MLDNLKATDDSDKSADGIKLLEEAKANIVKAQKKQKQYYDKKHCIKGMHICMYTCCMQEYNFVQVVMQWETKCSSKTSPGKKEKEGKWIINGGDRLKSIST